MKHNIFTRKNGEWALYVQSVTPVNGRRIAAALESDGESVLIVTNGKCLGKHVYQTPAREIAERA